MLLGKDKMGESLPRMKPIEIEANRINREYLQDLFRFKDLFIFFALRDILVRYRQAFFGIAWAIIRPVMTMAVFALIFGKIAKLPSENINYGLFVLAGMIPWVLFSNVSQDTCQSLLNNALLITKTYFPRMIIPLSQIMVHLLDFAVNIAFLAVLLSFSTVVIEPSIFFSIFFFLLLVTLCIGVGLWISALTVQYRDFRILVPFFVQFGMFLSPIGYGTFVVPERWQYLYFLNPIVGIIDGFRWSLFGITYPLLSLSILSSLALSLILLVTGFFYFRRMERSFADKL